MSVITFENDVYIYIIILLARKHYKLITNEVGIGMMNQTFYYKEHYYTTMRTI